MYYMYIDYGSPGDGSEDAGGPHHPKLGAESVPHQLQHLEQEPHHDCVLRPDRLHEKSEQAGLQTVGKRLSKS